MATKKYNSQTAKDIIEKSKQINLDESDDRMQDLPHGAPFKRASVKYDILESLATGVHSKATIEFGGYEFTVRLLSTKEIMEIETKARNYVVGEKVVVPYHEKYIDGLHTLAKALASCPEADDGILKVTDLECLDLNFFLGLLNEYRAFVAKCDITLDNMTDEEFSEVVELIRTKQLQLRGLPHRLLVKVATFFMGFYEIITQPTDNTPTQS